MTTLVRVRDLRWDRGPKSLLDIPTLDLEGPGLVLLVGPSGAGKSSLLKALTGTLAEFQGGRVAGTVTIDDRRDEHPRIAYVAQDARDSLLANDPLTEFQLRLQAVGWRPAAAMAEARRLLARAGFDAIERRTIDRLSSGERRRLALEANLIHGPAVILLDEPLNHLDAYWRPKFLNDVSAAAERALVVVATHDPHEWAPLSPMVLHMDAGRVVPVAPTVPRPHLLRSTATREVGKTFVTARGLGDQHGLFADVDLDLGAGLHAVVGHNGAGKSTLLRLLGGISAPKQGTVHLLDGHVSAMRPKELARVRSFHLEEPGQIFYMDHARDEVEFQPRNAGATPSDAATLASHAMERFGIGPLADRHPGSLSGGELERLALACTDAPDPKVVFLDEPTQSLDAAGRQALYGFLERVRRDACIVVATHDPDLVDACDTVHRLDDRRLLRQSRLVEVQR